jgi:hypothetical protein
MSLLLSLDEEQDLAPQLIPLLDKLQNDIDSAEKHFQLEGMKLETIARMLPYNQQYYSQRAQEAKQLVKWLENHRAAIEARLTRNYLHGQRVYGSRETATLIAGEREMIQHNQLVIEASLIHQRLESIVQGFEQMGWMLGNITKLRVAELHNVII